MHVFAALLDPSNDGFDIGDAALVLGFIVALVTAFAAMSRAFTTRVQHIVHDEIRAATAPIQKGANGGLSLPDVARLAAWNAEALQALASAQGVTLPAKPIVMHKITEV